MGKKSKKKTRNTSQEQSDENDHPSLTIYWNRVYEKTPTDKRRLREYGLPPDTTVFRIVQCEREKATLYGDFDDLDRTESSSVTRMVQDIIEGRPPENYSADVPIISEPTPIFVRTRGRLKRIERKKPKGRKIVDNLEDKMTVVNANAPLPPEAIETIAAALLDMVEQEEKQAAESNSTEN